MSECNIPGSRVVNRNDVQNPPPQQARHNNHPARPDHLTIAPITGGELCLMGSMLSFFSILSVILGKEADWGAIIAGLILMVSGFYFHCQKKD